MPHGFSQYDVFSARAGDGNPLAVVHDADDLDTAVASADVISCVTGATDPVVKGALLQPGTHVDLIGGFSPTMREADDDVVRRASVFVDTYDDAAIAGDIAQPLDSGLITRDDLVADLAELVAGAHPGRTGDEEITMFKSAGTALEDLAAARLAFGCRHPGKGHFPTRMLQRILRHSNLPGQTTDR